MKNSREMFSKKTLISTIDELLPQVDLFDSEEELVGHLMDSILFLETVKLKNIADEGKPKV
jgi:hypothetical protein